MEGHAALPSYVRLGFRLSIDMYNHVRTPY